MKKLNALKKHEDGYSIIAMWNGKRQNDFIKA
ncbi:replication protein [Heyndrickxia coagulans]|nr:replication protein [Heyndrickxia coagulans]RCS35120.1 replication protein [Heyndrickxia coagulans]